MGVELPPFLVTRRSHFIAAVSTHHHGLLVSFQIELGSSEEARVKTSKLLCAAICIILVAPALLLMAQVPTGTIVGTVTDPQGAVVIKAKVSITNRDTGAARVLETKSDGSYSAAALPP